MDLTSEERKYFRHNKVLNEHVLELLKSHVKKYRKLNVKKRGYQRWVDARHPPMDGRLAELMLILTRKIINSPKFVYYSDDWRSDCVSNAMLLLLKYSHNFKLTSNNAIGYLYMATENAIIQELNAKKLNRDRINEVSINNIRESDLVSDDEFNVNLM